MSSASSVEDDALRSSDDEENEETSDSQSTQEDYESDDGSDEEDTEGLPYDEQVLINYKDLSSRRVDLIGDYAGDELFLIEGDSLLLRCFTDDKLDFRQGFQMLHAAYNVEHFLHNLVTRKANFHIAFFEANRELCLPPDCESANSAKYFLARAAIIRHLQVNLPKLHPTIAVNVFESVESADFAKYLSDTGLYFLMCHDGAESIHRIRKTITQQPKEERRTSPQSHRLEFREMILFFVRRGYNVALVNGLEWRDTKVMTMVLEQRRRFLPLKTKPKKSSPAASLDLPNFAAGLQKLGKTEANLTERERLAVLAVGYVLQSSSAEVEKDSLNALCHSFLVHEALLQSLPLSARRLNAETATTDVSAFIKALATGSEAMLQSSIWTEFHRGGAVACDVVDYVDGRLLVQICHGFELSSLDKEATTKLQQLCQHVHKTCGVKLTASSGETEHSQTNGATNETSTPPSIGKSHNLAVMPFSNPVFDQHLDSIHLKTDEAAAGEQSRSSARIFQEVTHWHNAKKPIITKGPATPASAKEEFWIARRNQWFMAEMRTYAASLTNSVGKSLEPETIVVGATKPNTTSSGRESPAELSDRSAGSDSGKSSREKPGGKKGGGKNAGKNANKQAIMNSIAAVAAKKEEASTEKILHAWHVACKNLEAEKDLRLRYVRSKDYVTSLKGDRRDLIGAEVELFMLSTLINNWIQICRNKQKEQRTGVAALIWNTARSLAHSRNGLTKTIASKVELTFKILDLPSVSVDAPSSDRALPFKFALPAANDALSVGLSSKDFQLLHCGPYLDRSFDSAPDPRVEFEPDGWQRRVLDGIDAKKSLFVVAPTSAGKTFISFYAMRKILDADDDGVLVYVAPTKALVNQIAAEIQARYSKKFKYAGKSVWAIHTRDYRINSPTGCQVLVTVPHVLQIMLLAPSHANSWSNKVKRIIFDEVHSIGQAEDGVVWEQLLLLAPCPIIALSATVGNPQEFSGWLTSTQKAIGQELTTVQHPYRYSDLRKYYYVPPEQFAFRGLPDRSTFGSLGLDGTVGFNFIHPVAGLVDKSRGIPDDLALEPRDCFYLWQSMIKHQTKEFPVSSKLDPAKCLPKIVRKSEILEWEKGLKDLLREWLADSTSPFDQVMRDIEASFRDSKREKLQISQGTESKIRRARSAEDPNNLLETTLPLLCRLHEQDALPAILFNYDRHMCEKLCKVVVDQLAKGETAYKESSPKWKSTLEKYEEWKKIQEKLASKKSKTSKTSKKVSKDDREDAEGDKVSKLDQQRDAGGAEASPWDSFDPDAPVEGYHFADHKKLQLSELQMYIRQLGRRNIQQWLIDAVSRGIGVHHAGMNRKYRQVVEILFRKGFLRVIVATGTLALGINMPCKTVVFSGDSVFLTALNFRQCAGRAGRRGFDLLGNVVFQGISRAKVCRLLSSRLPDLNGHFPITTTLVLRLFTLLHESKNAKYAITAINALLSQPRMYMGGPSFKDQTMHHLRFSIEYLRRQYLLDSRGATLNFAGLVSHLYFTENSSFAFHALLKEGYFHELCADIDTKEKDTVETLMLVMAHLFGRIYCRQADEEFREKVVKPSSSLVFLPPLPSGAANILRQHNRETLQVFKTYVETFVEQHIKDEDCRMPLTGTRTGGEGDQAAESAALHSLPPAHIRSAFVALSGSGDEFDSIHDLCQTAREGVFLEEAVIPHVGVYPDEMDVPLNAWLLDFFKHGDVFTIERANGVRRADIWFLLNDFSLVLATIITSLMNFCKLKPGNDMDLLDVMGNLDAHEEAEDDKVAASDPADTSLPIIADSTTQPEKPVTAKKKAKNVDSWEEVADEEDAIVGAQERQAKTAARHAAEAADAPAWENEDNEGLLKVLKALQKLNTEFNLKFKAMWA